MNLVKLVIQTKWRTIILFCLSGILSIIVSHIFKLPWFLAFVIMSIIPVVLVWNFYDKLLKRTAEALVVEEKLGEISNLLQKSKGDLEERNVMLQQKMGELSSMAQISKAMTTTMELDKVLEIILEGIKKNVQFDRAIICLTDEQGRVIEGKKAVGVDKDVSDLRISLEEKDDTIVRAVLDGRPYIISAIEQASPILRRALEATKNNNMDSVSPSTKIFIELFAGLQHREQALAVVPLVAKEKVVGLLLVDNLNSKRPIEERDLRSLVTYTNQAGLAIENARLYNTERKFNEELQRKIDIARKELESAQTQLIRNERMSALGEMTAVVAHEVRNPMASVRGSAQRIDQKIAPTDPNKKYTQFIMTEIDRLERIVKNMLSYTRQPDPITKEENINQLLEEIVASMTDEINRVKVNLKYELDLTLPTVAVDAALLRQVILNIVQNALFFMSEREERVLRLATFLNGSGLKIAVGDTGPGIPPEIQKKVFEPFFTTKASGTGLGLAICQRLIEAHKGEILLNSEMGKGSTFTIALPLKK